MNTLKLSVPTREIVYPALFAAAICMIAPFSFSIGPIPLSFTTFIIYLAAGSLNLKQGLLSVLLYIALGAIGLPVFSNFEGGFYKIAGPTGGFIIGYMPLALLTGLFAEHYNRKRLPLIFGMTIGTILLYTCGMIWLMFQLKIPLAAAVSVCVTPFIIGDTLKITLASAAIPRLRAALRKSIS